jgi:methionyl-tRNA formyltransferase
MRIVFVGSGAFAIPTLRWLTQSDHEVALVITQPARGAGRGRKTARTPVAAIAEDLGHEVLQVEDINAPDMVARIGGLGARLGLVIAFGQKLKPDVLGALPGGFINLHASLLPKYRGAAPINWAILRGEERTGCTVFRIDDRMDTGRILASRWTLIKPEETAGELHDRLAGVGVDAVDAALALYADDATPEGTPQDDTEATTAPKLRKADGFVHFDRSAREVANLICGMTPWPGATARYEAAEGRWENVQLVRARVAEDASRPSQPPGTIDARRYVAAQDTFVEILEIKPSSGRIMTWQDYVNGRHVAEGDRFSTPEPSLT